MIETMEALLLGGDGHVDHHPRGTFQGKDAPANVYVKVSMPGLLPQPTPPSPALRSHHVLLLHAEALRQTQLLTLAELK